MSRRSAARASRARVSSFSLTSKLSQAVCHSSGETMGGVFTPSPPPSGSRRLSPHHVVPLVTEHRSQTHRCSSGNATDRRFSRGGLAAGTRAVERGLLNGINLRAVAGQRSTARRPRRRRVVEGVVEPVLDHPKGQKVFLLLAQDPPQSVDVVLVELAVARRGPLGWSRP